MTHELFPSNIKYCILTDAAADLDDNYLNAHPEVRVIPMSVVLEEQEYTYGPGGNLSQKQFYELLNEKSNVSTSQINIEAYLNYFEQILASGMDILYLCFSSGLSGMYQNAVFAAEEMMQTFPERKILCVDTLCAAPGEGALVREAVQQMRRGLDLESLAEWSESNKHAVSHWFTVDNLMYLHKGGRVSASTAVLGTALQIKPLLNVDSKGMLQVVGKSRGTKRAMSDLIHKMSDYWMPEWSKSVAVVHADSQEQANQLQKMVEQQFPEASVYQAEIGPVIGSHTGSGLLALVFWGGGRDMTDKIKKAGDIDV